MKDLWGCCCVPCVRKKLSAFPNGYIENQSHSLQLGAQGNSLPSSYSGLWLFHLFFVGTRSPHGAVTAIIFPFLGRRCRACAPQLCRPLSLFGREGVLFSFSQDTNFLFVARQVRTLLWNHDGRWWQRFASFLKSSSHLSKELSWIYFPDILHSIHH